MEGGEVFSGYSKTSAESYITHVHLVRGMRKSIFPSSEKKSDRVPSRTGEMVNGEIRT